MCICHLVVPIANRIRVVILQHPNEVNHPKGSAWLLQHSLLSCQCIVDENFTDNAELNNLMVTYQNRCFLLYPDEMAAEVAPLFTTTAINPTEPQTKPSADYCLILLDGTWKKSYKMYQLSKNLHSLPKLTLPKIEGAYKIRSTQKQNALSSLEACCYALTILENELEKYQPLLTSFVQFNNMQLAFKPSYIS
jgi:DTW domain-containing protein YfiP